MLDDVEMYRDQMVETAVEMDDDLMMAYMEGEQPSIEDIKRCIRKGYPRIGLLPHLLWFGLQKQRYAVVVGRGSGLPACAT